MSVSAVLSQSSLTAWLAPFAAASESCKHAVTSRALRLSRRRPTYFTSNSSRTALAVSRGAGASTCVAVHHDGAGRGLNLDLSMLGIIMILTEMRNVDAARSIHGQGARRRTRGGGRVRANIDGKPEVG